MISATCRCSTCVFQHQTRRGALRRFGRDYGQARPTRHEPHPWREISHTRLLFFLTCVSKSFTKLQAGHKNTIAPSAMNLCGSAGNASSTSAVILPQTGCAPYSRVIAHGYCTCHKCLFAFFALTGVTASVVRGALFVTVTM